MSTMTPEKATELRKEFPKDSIGYLPKGGQNLAFVGHAAVTDRLLLVDPLWSWEPLAVDERGLPALDSRGNLWIKLTVCGVTRIGVGDGKTAKEVIGDAIRNASMRFGVALDLWSQQELEGKAPNGEEGAPLAHHQAAPAAEPARPGTRTMSRPGGGPITEPQSKMLHALLKKHEMGDRETGLAYISHITGRELETSKDLTKAEASRVIDSLNATEQDVTS